MRWRMTRPVSSRQLLRAEHRLHLAVRRPRHWRRRLVVVLLLLLVTAWLAQQWHGQVQRAAALQADNLRLQQALEQQRLQMREAEASQAQLLQRISELSARTQALETELAFYRQQKSTH